MNNNLNLVSSNDSAKRAELFNAKLEGLGSDVRIVAADLENYARLRWKSTNLKLAESVFNKYDLSLRFVPGFGGGSGVYITSPPGRLDPSGGGQDLGSMLEEVQSDYNGGNMVDAVKTFLEIGLAVKDFHDQMTADQTNAGTSTGGGDRTEIVQPQAGNNSFSLSEVPEIQTTRVVEVPNNLYLQVTVRPETYAAQKYHVDGASAYLSCMQWAVPPTTNYAYLYWNNWVNRFQLLAQKRVGFNINAINKFSYTRMETYVNNLALAISTYLFYANTYQFTVMEGKNIARNKLRQMFSTNDIQLLALLKARLDDLPIPPRLYNELAHLYAIYHTSEHSSTSSTYSFCPMELDGANPNSMSSISTLTQGIRYLLNTVLDDLDFMDTCDMMARVLPEWVDVKVGHSQYTPHMYDADHLNVFMNSPGVTDAPDISSTTVQYVPRYDALSDYTNDKHYVSVTPHSPTVRGDQQALWSAFDEGAVGESWSGYLRPVVSTTTDGYTTNRFKFMYNTNNVDVWTFDNVDPHLGFAYQSGSQVYSNTFSNAVELENTPMGSYKLLGMNVDSCNTVQDNYLSFLLDIDFASSGGRSSSKYRRKKKKS